MSIRIVLADNHEIMREGLRTLIERQPDMTVIGEAGNGRMAIKITRKLLPDIVIMDISMPDFNGIEATGQITNEFQDIKVIMLSIHDDRFYVIKAFEAGAMSYVLKESSINELIHAIKIVINNNIYINPEIANIMFEVFIRSQSINKYLKSFLLTGRESEVLQMIAEGKTTKAIARIFNVSIKTIESQRKNIMDKLEVHSIAKLTKYAIRQGLTTLEK